MTFRGVAASLIVAIGLTGTPAFTSGAAAQQAGAAQLNDHILPVAAGALIGAAAGFFSAALDHSGNRSCRFGGCIHHSKPGACRHRRGCGQYRRIRVRPVAVTVSLYAKRIRSICRE